jgi:predicted adenylyl cyclase CyaB
MKIFIVCSKHFYDKIPEIKEELEKAGHIITLPGSFDKPLREEDMKKLGSKEHSEWKQGMMRLHEPKVKANDAILVLNFEKNGQPNYIGGATFMEVVKAWEFNKRIFFYNPIPENIFTDELKAINPTVINKNISLIEQNQKQKDKNIEVEIRSFISKEKYEELLEFFKNNSKFIEEDSQETHYFDCEQDLRIQKNNKGSKIWLKKGKIHDDAREEIEIFTKDDSFEDLGRLFNALDNNIEIKWLRKRNEFDWNGIKACIDYTKGYGYIIELEKLSSEEEKDEVLIELKNKLNELNIPLTPREEFDERYNYYKENWRRLIA